MKRGHILIMLLLNALLLGAGQFVFPLGGAMGSDFHYAQEDKSKYTAPEENVLPRMSACDGVPAGQPGHDDDLPTLIFAVGVAFLVAVWTQKLPDQDAAILAAHRAGYSEVAVEDSARNVIWPRVRPRPRPRFAPPKSHWAYERCW
jgi:hypothetical protein